MNEAKESLFRGLDDITHVGKLHHRPLVNNFETVDSFISREWLIQTTVSPTHDVKMTGLNKVLKRLSDCGDETEPRLFFVAPKGAYDKGFKKQQPIKTGQKDDAKKAGEAGQTQQCVMCVPLSLYGG